MTAAEAAAVIGILNAGYPREALEGDTRAVWVNLTTKLSSAAAAREAAVKIIEGSPRFPSYHEFRETYKTAVAKLAVGHEIEQADDSVPPDPETHEWFERMQRSGWQGVTKDIP